MMTYKTKTKSLLCALCALCGFNEFTWAQSRQVPAPPQAQPIVIFNATIHPVSSEVIERGYIVFDKGAITNVGGGEAPQVAGAVALNADGLHIYPGLVASFTNLGLTEIGAVDVTNDYSELGRVTPEVRAAAAINPDSDHIPVTRANGILTALVFPRGGLITGRASSIKLDGWTWEQMAIDAEAGLVIDWPRTEPFTAPWIEESEAEQRKQIKEDLEAIEKIFDEAEAYVRARDASPKVASDLRFEAMRPILSGEKPVFIMASLASEIEAAIAWAHRRNLTAVIVGGGQADQATSLLKEHDIPVIITATHRLPSRRHDDYDQPYSLPAKLHAAGVRFCLATGGSASSERNLNHMAGTAAAYGLPKEEALRAATLSAAQIIGLGEKYGSLEVGKSATIIITAGDPLEITTDTLVAFIDGRRIDLTNRHKALYEKYQEKYRQLGLLTK